ncbi:MAG: hypothetical protein V1802_00650 [Candidatus Aenigmatarchaeota archaeon]
MHSAVKLIIGIVILLVGIYWYAEPMFGGSGISKFLAPNTDSVKDISTSGAFRIVFSGLFGLLLIFLGAIIAWIEYEDIKWEMREKKESKTHKEEKATKK